jgi:pimeloyl-ACP methyl ester carboxylesterase
VNGVNLAVEVRGEGPAVLFVHGYPLDHTIWADQVAGLEGYRRIAPDLRGTGRSDAPDLGYGIGIYADDLAALLDALGVGEVILCGFSMGGYIAFEFLRRWRSRVRALVLVSTRAEADTADGRRGRDTAAALARESGSGAIADGMLDKMLTPATLSSSPELARRVRELMAAAPVSGLVGALSAMRDRPDSMGLLPMLEGIPVLVIVGAEDPVTPPDRARAMADAIPGARLEVIPGAAHLTVLERPKEVTGVIRAFLEGMS